MEMLTVACRYGYYGYNASNPPLFSVDILITDMKIS